MRVQRPAVLTGNVYGDASGQYRKGARMGASRIKNVLFIDGYPLFRTIAGILYVVVGCLPGGSNIYMNHIYH